MTREEDKIRLCKHGAMLHSSILVTVRLCGNAGYGRVFETRYMSVQVLGVDVKARATLFSCLVLTWKGRKRREVMLVPSRREKTAPTVREHIAHLSNLARSNTSGWKRTESNMKRVVPGPTRICLRYGACLQNFRTC